MPDGKIAVIYEDLVVEHWWDPLDQWAWPSPSWFAMPTPCPICGIYDPVRMDVADHSKYDLVCATCWQLKRHLQPEAWHCADCNVFLSWCDRFVIVVPVTTPVFLCRNHYRERTGAAV